MAGTPGGLKMYDGKSERQRLAEGELILSDHVNGMKMSALMGKYDMPESTLRRRIDAALKARIAPTVDAYREQQNTILDEQLERCHMHLRAAKTMMEQGDLAGDLPMAERGMQHHLKAMAMLERTVESRRKLNGLDMPVRTEVSVVVETEQDRELAELVREAKVKAAAIQERVDA